MEGTPNADQLEDEIYTFVPLSMADGTFGPKANRLQEMTAMGLPVPKAYVLRNVAEVDRDSLLPAVKALMTSSFPDRSVIVRSSADDEDAPIANSPGVYDSFVNRRTADEVLDSIVACIESLHSEDAVSYRKLRGLPPESAMHVIVQEMVTCTHAGVLNTRNPVDERATMLAEFVHGIGTNVVTGRGEVQRLLIPRTPAKVTTTSWSLDQGLEAVLSAMGLVLEAHFGSPQEIEWGVENDRLYIFQSRDAALDSGPVERPAQRPTPFRAGTADPVSPGYAIGALGENAPVRLAVLANAPTAADLFNLGNVAGIVQRDGGPSSHSASLCREAGLPTVRSNLELVPSLPYLLDAVAGELRPLASVPVSDRKRGIFAAVRRLTHTNPNAWMRDDKYETVVFDPVDQSRILDTLLKMGTESQVIRQSILPFDDEQRTYTGISVRVQADERGARLQFKRANVLPDRPYRFDEEVHLRLATADEGVRFAEWLGYVPFTRQERDIEIFRYGPITVHRNLWPGAAHAYIGIDAPECEAIEMFLLECGLSLSAVAPLDGKDLFGLLAIGLDSARFSE